MPVAGRKPTGKPTRDRNPRAHEWTEVQNVPFVGAPKLPKAQPDGRPWPASTKRWYEAVSTMPHCRLWSPSDWMFAEHTARLVAAFDGGEFKQATEIRQREKKMGVTADDRRDLRIRYVDPKPESDTAAEVTNLDDYRDL